MHIRTISALIVVPGRENLRAELVEWFEDVAERGTGSQLVVVDTEPGSGTSTVLDAFIAACNQDQAVRVRVGSGPTLTGLLKTRPQNCRNDFMIRQARSRCCVGLVHVRLRFDRMGVGWGVGGRWRVGRVGVARRRGCRTSCSQASTRRSPP